MDPGTGLTVLGTALGSKELVGKILGPTADYLGAGMRDWTERSVKNVGRVFEKAKGRLGDKIDTPGAVPPKVLKGILEEGPFCDDELAAEYFGGVLASSRTEVGRDDRGASFISLIGRLSSYQIRSHFAFYSIIREIYQGSTENIGTSHGRLRLSTFIPFTAYVPAMEFDGRENVPAILSHVMFGLSREALIAEQFMYGTKEVLHYALANGPGIVFAPSALGVELFLWAHGRNDLLTEDILNPAVELTSSVDIKTGPGIRSTVFADRGFPKPVEAAKEPAASASPARGT
jgi:hypothetical protein